MVDYGYDWDFVKEEFNVFMNLVQIPIKELDKVWGVVEKDIRSALAYSSQLTDSDFVLQVAREGKFQIWVIWDKDKQKTNE